jgi:DNA mismatch repair ATPase MutS
MIDLIEWKKQNRDYVKLWIETMSETEVLVSQANFAFNHSEYCFPVIDDSFFHFEADGLGHPLIPVEKRVGNHCLIDGKGQIMLITGSNMAGKSTFLRSVGVNTVLAMMGSPVCASSFKASYVHIISSMRIADNLTENTSTFYAELKKLKTIIDKVNGKEKLLILMDEILRGTNSFDRHAGSEALLEQLIREKAVALVATHDDELGALEKKYPDSIHNFHFDVQVIGEELFFDFKLKDGICRSMNASILMKKIGINIQ